MNIPAKPSRAIVALLASGLLSSCSASGLDRVAGSQIDEGGFGTPTTQNMMVMTSAEPALGHLGSRFASEVPSTINFAFDSDVLDATARAALDLQANFMRRFPEVRFSVYGHADEVGSPAYNKDLGLRRARAAVAFIGARGVSLNRLEALVSYGETRPVVATLEPERANRRTVTEVSGFVAGAPMLLDGKYGRLAYRRYVARVTYPATNYPSLGTTTQPTQ